MAEFPYTPVTGKLTLLLEKIRLTGVPPKASVAWLRSIGFTSSNDISIIPIIKFIGLCDQSGVPSDKWKQYRGAHHATVLAECIKAGYTELFSIYPSAQQQSDSDLSSFFSTRSSAGQQVITKTVSTFKALCSKADFNSAVPTNVHVPASTGAGPHTAPPSHSSSPTPPTSTGVHPEVHIDIQIHISPEATVTQIDQIFKSMSTHLYGRE